jgi:hypothetical protein
MMGWPSMTYVSTMFGLLASAWALLRFYQHNCAYCSEFVQVKCSETIPGAFGHQHQCRFVMQHLLPPPYFRLNSLLNHNARTVHAVIAVICNVL